MLSFKQFVYEKKKESINKRDDVPVKIVGKNYLENEEEEEKSDNDSK